MSQSTTKAHVVRAALEGISYQTREVNSQASLFRQWETLFKLDY
jgi:glycerol kinase